MKQLIDSIVMIGNDNGLVAVGLSPNHTRRKVENWITTGERLTHVYNNNTTNKLIIWWADHIMQ